MEVIESRYGLDRTIEKLDYQTMRVMGESKFIRTSENKRGETTMFDFEGGPCLTLGGKIHYGKLNWKITEIQPHTPTYKDLTGCLVTVVPMY
jgi:hypothetical protein